MNETTQAATNPTPDDNNQQDARVKFEAARLTRRQALAKFGFRFGMVAVAALSVDDLVRATGQALQQRADTNKAVEQVARELQRAGVANADMLPPDTDPIPCDGCGECVETDEIECVDCDPSCGQLSGSGSKKKPKPKPSVKCKQCCTDYAKNKKNCHDHYKRCIADGRDGVVCSNEEESCLKFFAHDPFFACKAKECPPGFSC